MIILKKTVKIYHTEESRIVKKNINNFIFFVLKKSLFLRTCKGKCKETRPTLFKMKNAKL